MASNVYTRSGYSYRLPDNIKIEGLSEPEKNYVIAKNYESLVKSSGGSFLAYPYVLHGSNVEQGVANITKDMDYLISKGYDPAEVSATYQDYVNYYPQAAATNIAKYGKPAGSTGSTGSTGLLEGMFSSLPGELGQIGSSFISKKEEIAKHLERWVPVIIAIGAGVITGGAASAAIGAVGGAAAAGSVAGGAAAGAAGGAASGATSAAIRKEDVGEGAWKGAATGAITGGALNGIGGAASDGISNGLAESGVVGAGGISQTTADTIANVTAGAGTGAAGGATISAINGGDIGEGAYMGAAGGAIGAGTQDATTAGSNTLKDLGMTTGADTLSSAVYGAGTRATLASLSGGDPAQAAIMGGISGATKGSTSGGTMASSDDQWIDGISNEALISLGLGAGAAAYQGYVANDNANNAQQAVNQAIQTQTAAGDKALSLQDRMYNEQKTNLNPYVLAGNRALAQTTQMVGVTGGKDYITGDADYNRYLSELEKPNAAIYEDPVYKFQQAEANKNLSRNLRALGRENSTYGMNAMGKQSNQLAVDTLNQRNSRLSGLVATRYSTLSDQYNRLRELAANGQSAAAGLGAAGQNYANTAGTTLTNMANNQANAGLSNQLIQSGQSQNNFNNLSSLANLGVKAYQAYNAPKTNTEPQQNNSGGLYGGAYTPALSSDGQSNYVMQG